MEHHAAMPATAGVIRLDTEISLDPVSLEDAPALYACIDRNRERLREWLPWVTPEYTIEHTRRFLADRAREHADRLALTCVIRTRGEIAGAISLHWIDQTHRATSIGYWIDGAFAGQGIMTRACRAIVDAGFRDYGLHRIEIRCAAGNHRSCAIPRRLGFTEEGLLREAQWLFNRWVDLRVFGMLEHEWR